MVRERWQADFIDRYQVTGDDLQSVIAHRDTLNPLISIWA